MARHDDLKQLVVSDFHIGLSFITVSFGKRKNDQVLKNHSNQIQITNDHLCPRKFFLLYIAKLSQSLGKPYLGYVLPSIQKIKSTYKPKPSTIAPYSSIRSNQTKQQIKCCQKHFQNFGLIRSKNY